MLDSVIVDELAVIVRWMQYLCMQYYYVNRQKEFDYFLLMDEDDF